MQFTVACRLTSLIRLEGPMFFRERWLLSWSRPVRLNALYVWFQDVRMRTSECNFNYKL